ncbi:MAG: Ig-like domain-containing protein, partial [Verrucomicrobia bacterium]|nr:Ig-like domain-containing protein [Verrucomicrobiota bacterium]
MRTMSQPYRNPRGLCAAAILACLSATAGAAPIPISSLVDDFDINVNSTNSTWSYGTVVPASNPFVMKLLDTKTKTMSGIFSSDTALPVWGSTDYSWAYWMLGKNTGASAIHNIWGDTLDFQPGTVMLYPGNLLVSWLAPSDMVINANWTFTRISARKSGSPYPAGQGTDYRVTHRSGAVDTTVVGFAGVARPGGTLYASHTNSFTGLSVKAGDRVFWEIAGFNNTVDVDATDAAITITAAPSLASHAIVDDHGGGPVATGTLVTYTVTFSHDMDASTISADDFGNAGTAGVSIGTVTETAPTSGVFTVPVTPTTTGILQLQVNAGAILNDADGIPLNTTSAIADDTTLTVATPGDTTPPTLTSIADDKSGGPAERNALVTYTVTFDEAMDPSTISAADFSNAGTAAVTIDTATQTAPAVFSVPVTPTTTGTLQLQVNAGAELKDLAANALVTTSAIPDDTTLAVNDTIPPTLTSIVDDKSGATIAPNTLVTYTVTFSEGMDAGTVSDADFGNAGTAAVTIGTVTETTPGVFTVQATPTSGGTLQLQVNAGAELKDIAGNALVTTSAILDDTTITVDGTPPTIATLSPADDATGVTLCANLEVTFSEAIAIGTGNLTIKNLSDNTQSTIDITSGSPQVSVSGSQLRITPAADLAMLRSYAIQIDASAIMDLYGNFFAGIADDTTWNFTTATSWSLANDFNIHVNSMSSTWSYGTVVPASNPFVMKLLDTKTKTMSGIFSSDTALPVWGSTDYSWAYWMLGKNTGTTAIHNIWGDILDFQPGTVMLFPAPPAGQPKGQNLLVSWLAPSDMVINANWTFTRISARKSGSPYPAGQ